MSVILVGILGIWCQVPMLVGTGTILYFDQLRVELTAHITFKNNISGNVHIRHKYLKNNNKIKQKILS